MSRIGDFSRTTKRTLCLRVNGLCSNPKCLKPTTGPHSESAKVILNGEAAHIHSATPRGPRYIIHQDPDFFSDIENGIWLCRSCHAVVDRDDDAHSVDELIEWKHQAEKLAKEKQLRSCVETSKPAIKEMWVHETTNDKSYIPRKEVLDKLNHWLNGDQIKVITITGIRGQGKTSLVGHWLQSGTFLSHRNVQGVFYWSFYSETDVNMFFKQLIEFCKLNFDLTSTSLVEENAINTLRDILAEISICIVLDGLEVIQHEISNRAKGQFVNNDLRYFLFDICLTQSNTFAVLTSRLEIVDLKQFHKALKNMPLARLKDDEACHLLERLFVGGTYNDRCQINQVLEGHPLALKVFAAGLSRDCQGNPISHLNQILTIIPKQKNKLSDKINRLLNYYENSLDPLLNALLCGVSLLHKSIDEKSLIALCKKQAASRLNLPKLDENTIAIALSSLVTSGLIIKDIVMGHKRYSCHPIVRDFFRSTITKDPGRGSLVGEFLADRPGNLTITDNETLEWLVSAIEVLAESGSWAQANEIYDTKLNNGFLFTKLVNPEGGWRSAVVLSNFSPNKPYYANDFGERTDHKNTKVFYLNAAGQFSRMMGDVDNTIKYYQSALKVFEGSIAHRNQAISLLGLTEIYIESGDLFNAYHSLEKAIKLAGKRNMDLEFVNRLHLARGKLHFLRNELEQAINRYGKVHKSFHKSQKYHTDLKALSLYGLAEVAIEQMKLIPAMSLLKQADALIEHNGRQDLMVTSGYLWGRVYFVDGCDTESIQYLKDAENIARASRMEFWLTKVAIIQALLMSRSGLFEKAQLVIDECIGVSRSRKFETLLIDAIISKAQLVIFENETTGKKSGLLEEAKRCVNSTGYELASEHISMFEKAHISH